MPHDLVIPFSTLEAGIASLIGAGDTPAPASAIGPLQVWEARGTSVWSASALQMMDRASRWPTPAVRLAGRSAGAIAVQWLAAGPARARPFPEYHDRISALRASQGTPLRGQPLLLLLVDAAGHLVGWLDIDGQLQPLDSIRVPGPGMLRQLLSSSTVPRPDGSDDLAASRFSRLAGAIGTAALRGIQSSTFALIGGGRVGSSIAETLVRNGASLVIIDPDTIEPHNANDSDGLLPSLHEGLYKSAVLARVLRPLARPGAVVEGRRLSVASRVAAHVIGTTDMVVSAVDNAPARYLAAVWAAAASLPHLDIGIGLPLQGGAGADVRLVLPPDGCLLCQGGLGDYEHLLDGVVKSKPVPPDFGVQRRGSARSVGVTAAHLGVRLIEQLFEGRVQSHRFLQLQEDAETGALQLLEGVPRGHSHCLLCRTIGGVGVAEVDWTLVASLAARVAGSRHLY